MGDGGGPAPRQRDVRQRGARQRGDRMTGSDVLDASFFASSPHGAKPSVEAVPASRSGHRVLLDALLDPEPESAARVLRGIVVAGPDRFVDVLLPEAARRLGEMWRQDRIGFAEVTIASSRLQGALREVDQVDPGLDVPDAPLVAVVLRPGETHSLGATVAAWRLRRAGASVMLMLNLPIETIERNVGGGDLSAVCLSSSGGVDAETLAGLVGRLRAASGAPVLLGGAILEDVDTEALRRACGADRVSREPEDALRLARELRR